jgi:hypothetical protein
MLTPPSTFSYALPKTLSGRRQPAAARPTLSHTSKTFHFRLLPCSRSQRALRKQVTALLLPLHPLCTLHAVPVKTQNQQQKQQIPTLNNK